MNIGAGRGLGRLNEGKEKERAHGGQYMCRVSFPEAE